MEYLQKYLSVGQVLLAQSHERKEALDYDKYAVCIFKRHEEDISKLSLIGHVRVELSKLLNQFLKADTGSSIYIEVIGKRKWEVGHLWYQQSSLPAQNVVEQQESSMNNCQK